MTGSGGPGNSSLDDSSSREAGSGLLGEGADPLSEAILGAGWKRAVLASMSAFGAAAALGPAPNASRWEASVAPLLLMGIWPGGVLGSVEIDWADR